MVYSQARRFVPASNRSAKRSALTSVSCTRSSASARLRVSRRAVPYNGSTNVSTSARNASRSGGLGRRNIYWPVSTEKAPPAGKSRGRRAGRDTALAGPGVRTIFHEVRPFRRTPVRAGLFLQYTARPPRTRCVQRGTLARRLEDSCRLAAPAGDPFEAAFAVPSAVRPLLARVHLLIASAKRRR